jgi:hypothetical protein
MRLRLRLTDPANNNPHKITDDVITKWIVYVDAVKSKGEFAEGPFGRFTFYDEKEAIQFVKDVENSK